MNLCNIYQTSDCILLASAKKKGRRATPYHLHERLVSFILAELPKTDQKSKILGDQIRTKSPYSFTEISEISLPLSIMEIWVLFLRKATCSIMVTYQTDLCYYLEKKVKLIMAYNITRKYKRLILVLKTFQYFNDNYLFKNYDTQ